MAGDSVFRIPHGLFQLVSEFISVGRRDHNLSPPTRFASNDQNSMAGTPGVGPILGGKFLSLGNGIDIAEPNPSNRDAKPPHGEVMAADSIVVIMSVPNIEQE